MERETIRLEFDPFTLPTAQHRAGLAGLLALTESLRRRRIGPLPSVSATESNSITVQLTRRTLQVMFDDLYGAIWEERRSRARPQGTNIRNVRHAAVEGAEERSSTTYRFETVAPKAAFLKALGMPEPWLKLWREAMWATLRGIPRTRFPYLERAQGRPAGEAGAVWSGLHRCLSARADGHVQTLELASSLFVGAQASSAERVPFRDRADHALLLHFWPVVMCVYVPEAIDREGRHRSVGYVLTVPDVIDPLGFVHDFSGMVAQLETETVGFRPKMALVAVPQEGGLEYLRHVSALVRAKAETADPVHDLAAVEVYHLERRGNSIHLLSAQRLAASRQLVEKYDAIRGRYADLLFRRQMILNILRGDPWYRGFQTAFAVNERERFLGAHGRSFARDARRAFEGVAATGGGLQ